MIPFTCGAYGSLHFMPTTTAALLAASGIAAVAICFSSLARRARQLFSMRSEARRWHDKGLESYRRFVPISRYHRFVVGEVGALTFLREHGFVVFRSVLTRPDCQKALSMIWDFLEATAPRGQKASEKRLDRDDPSTWDRWPESVEGGILPYGGAGQSTAAWFVRGIPAVHAAFAQIWGTSDLVSSFDTMSIWRPWSAATACSTSEQEGSREHRRQQRAHRRKWKTEVGWFHIDQ